MLVILPFSDFFRPLVQSTRRVVTNHHIDGEELIATQRHFLCSILLSGMLALACPSGSGGGTAASDDGDPALAVYQDPGVAPWKGVEAADLIDVCGLDPDILADIDAATSYPYLVVRYGRLCHEHYPAGQPGPFEMSPNFSVTKTLGATTVALAATMSATLPPPWFELSDEDRMDFWIDNITFNPDALVAHVLSMVGHNVDLSFGQKVWDYDPSGDVQINRLSDVVEAVITQDPTHFGGATTTTEFAQLHLFDKLGMLRSDWDASDFGAGWTSSVRDMARLGLLLVHEGVWDRRRLIDPAWVYRMTHPVFEDANTGYGYLTWLASSKNYKIPSSIGFELTPNGDCQPSAYWPEFPHTLSEATDCGYDGDYPCSQQFDVGPFAAAGGFGQVITAHPGLDLVIVTRNGDMPTVTGPWDLIRSALIEHDPVYAGDEAAFCAAYSAGDYAPDLIIVP